MGQEYWAYHLTDHCREAKAGGVLAGVDRPDVVRLHLGAGNRYFRDYINVDVRGDRLDREADITSLPEGDGTVDEILLIHVFEHFWVDEADKILGEYYRVLKPGGRLVMEMPDLKKVLEFFKDPKAPLHVTYGALYGGYIFGSEGKTVEDLHKWCWTFETLAAIAKKVGFECEEGVPQYHLPQRDFRIVCVKPVQE